MPLDYFQVGATPAASDTPRESLQKINSLAIYPPIPGFSIPAFSSISLSYHGTTNNVATAIYKDASGNTLATLTILYVGGTPATDDAKILTATRS